MKNTPKLVGERSEGQILAAFLRAGRTVLTPFGDSQRYDLVLDDDGKFTRVQCKTGRIVRGGIAFKCHSSNWNTGEKFDYKGQADIFAVYVPQLDKVYLVPVADVGMDAVLRLEPTKNGQSRGVRMASDYEFKF